MHRRAVIAAKENDNIAQWRICAYSSPPLSTLLHQEDAARAVFSQWQQDSGMLFYSTCRGAPRVMCLVLTHVVSALGQSLSL